MNGLLYVDKPVGLTSHDVVAIVRRAARTKRVGHAGTLDPFATGLLVVAVGMCTRLLPYVLGEPKVYNAVIRFGAETDTDDATGDTAVTRVAPDFGDPAIQAMLTNAIASLTGRIAQVPPVYSAKHVDGERSHALARRGHGVTLPPVGVTVHQWSQLEIVGERLRVRITCAGGTYVRALARDLGRAMGSAAHCLELRRERSGDADVLDAVSVAALRPGAIAESNVALRSPLDVLQGMAHQLLNEVALRDLAHGRPVSASVPGERAALLAVDPITNARTVVGIGERTTDDRWQPKVVLLGDAT